MKNLTIVPLYGYWAKFAGLAIAVVMGLVWFSDLALLAPQYNKLGFVLGLVLAASARQRQETGRAQAMRYLSLKASFFLVVSLLMSVSMIESLRGSLLLIAGTGLTFHLILFNSLMWFGPESIDEQNTLQANIKANRKFYKTVVILLIVTVLGLAFLASR